MPCLCAGLLDYLTHMGSRSRCWQFTVNNPGYPDEVAAELLEKVAGVRYFVFQREVAPETGTVHLQGVIGFKNPRRFNGVVQLDMFDDGRQHHYEIARSVPALVSYCQQEYFMKEPHKGERKRKEGHEAQVWGDLPRQGSKEPFRGLITFIDDNPDATWREIGWEHPVGARYLGYTEKLVLEVQERRSGPVECVWIYGKTGVGKTRKAIELLGESYYPKPADCKWWDGYKQETAVLIDDFAGALTMYQMLTWCDEYPCIVQTKGSWCQLQARHVVVTSNEAPWTFYPGVALSRRESLARRFKVHELVLCAGFRVLKARKWDFSAASYGSPWAKGYHRYSQQHLQ